LHYDVIPINILAPVTAATSDITNLPYVNPPNPVPSPVVNRSGCCKKYPDKAPTVAAETYPSL
jgi:hypothetical protein